MQVCMGSGEGSGGKGVITEVSVINMHVKLNKISGFDAKIR